MILNPKYLLKIDRVPLPTYIQMQWLKKWKIKTYIDVGVHSGQEVKVISEMFPAAKIIGFEPQKELFRALCRLENKNIIIENVAVGSFNGTTEILVPKYTPGASILKPGEQIEGELGELTAQKVKIITLDTYFKTYKFTSPTLLKIDTQGYEKEVLIGARKILKKIDIVYVETPLEAAYEKSAVFSEIYDLLREFGFSYHGTIPDGQFWPRFEISDVQNSIFLKDSSSLQ